MPFANYTELQQEIADYLGWELDGKIPSVIRLAEARMERDLRLRVMERRGTHITVRGVSSIWLPDKRIPGDWDVFMDMRDICLRDGSALVQLPYVTPDSFTDLEGRSGRPEAYSIIGRSLFMGPVPNGEYTVLLTYYCRIPPLSEAQPLNDILFNYPDIYLYASLVEATGYDHTSNPAQDWLALYQAAVTSAQYADSRARFSKNIRSKAPRRY